MASIIQLGNKWRAQVRRAGFPTQTKTFSDHEAATRWARKQEAEIDEKGHVDSSGNMTITVARMVDIFAATVPDSTRTVKSMFLYMKKELGHITLSKITKRDILKFIQNKKFSPSSGAQYFSKLCVILKKAKIVYGCHVPDILKDTKDTLVEMNLIASSNKRERRISNTELEKILAYKFKTKNVPMVDVILFALSSAMRQAEITRISYATFDVENKTILITDRKHPKKKKGNHQTVPLLDSSIEIINRQKKKVGDDRIFPYGATNIGAIFRNACQSLGIVDLHFHDLRHEATSRLFEMGYQIHEVAMFTGHTDWKMLERYTHLKAKDIRRLSPAKGVEVEKKAEIVKMDSEPKEVQMNPEIRERLKEEMRKELMAELFAKMTG